jgi:uncharacterized protein YlxW (UPF0749 family)
MDSPAPRLAVPLAAALLGFLAVLAARQPPQATREIRRLELADLVRQEDARVRALRGQVRELQGRLDAIEETSAGTSAGVREIRESIEELEFRGGTAGLQGPGVEVTLDDSTVGRSPTGDPNDLIVHERDIQTAVNALWAAGAEAVVVNGERLTAGSAVRCAGNTLLLHGVLHSPPYRIGAIGDPTALAEGFPEGPGMERLDAAARAFGIQLDLEVGTVRIEDGPPAGTFDVAQPSAPEAA